jgi:hypothetical protein
VTVNGALTIVSPITNTLTFNGTSTTQTITVHEASGSGTPLTLNAISSNSAVAAVTPTATTDGSGNATFTVTPLGSSNGSTASTTISITDSTTTPNGQCSLSPGVTVNVSPGQLTVSPLTLSFNGTSDSAQQLTATEADYTGVLSAASPAPSPAGIVSVTPSATSDPGGAGNVVFTVTPTGIGNTTVKITDNHSGVKSVPVTVAGATIGVSGSSTASFTVNDNTNQHLAATPIRITGRLQTTAGGTGAQVYIGAPADITGTNGGTLKISYLSYDCTPNGAGNNQGGTFSGGFLQLTASSTASNCLTFPANQFANLDFNVNLFLNDLVVPADSYSSTGGFTVYVSQT